MIVLQERARAMRRLLREAPSLLPSEYRPFSRQWLATVPPIVREYLSSRRERPSFNDVALYLLRAALPEFCNPTDGGTPTTPKGVCNGDDAASQSPAQVIDPTRQDR